MRRGIQAASLLYKVFLQYLVLLSEWDGMLELWLEIIEIMDRLMNSGQERQLGKFTAYTIPRLPFPGRQSQVKS